MSKVPGEVSGPCPGRRMRQAHRIYRILKKSWIIVDMIIKFVTSFVLLVISTFDAFAVKISLFINLFLDRLIKYI